MSKSTTDAIRDFRNAASAVFAQWATLAAISTSGLRDMLSYLGVDYYSAVKTSAENVITVTAPDTDMTAIVPSGKPEQYTEAALAEFASEHLRKLRQTVHGRIRRYCQTGHINAEQAIEALSALGYADSAKPSVKSSVQATIADDFGNTFEVSWTQDGSLSEEDVREGLDSQFGTHPVAAGILAAFPDAKSVRLPKLVSSVYVTSDLTWPDSALAE